MRDKAFKIVKNPKYDRYQRGFASMIYTFFDEKTSGQTDKSEIISNKESAEDLYKPIIKKIREKKSTFLFYRQYLKCWSCWYAINKQI